MTDQNGEQEFYVEQANGWFWVTEKSTGHNYAQTDRKERAIEICEQLNAGKRDFD